ncbi:MAG: hypothetical protein DHS20C19_04900 [Acidimicrobiales bacterium]|nr:MAG: hypothetical protein DHS20C19_04900 [Acidimicrobiales bacterium]
MTGEMGEVAAAGSGASRSAVIVATQIDLLEQLVVDAGYTVVGAAETGVNGERLVGHFAPDVVVVEHDLVGPSGLESIVGLRAAHPATRVLLVVNDEWQPRDLASAGAFAVVTMNRLGELAHELEDLGDWISAHATETATDTDRRIGRDRRVHQDWTKVGWERRSVERRAA